MLALRATGGRSITMCRRVHAVPALLPSPRARARNGESDPAEQNSAMVWVRKGLAAVEGAVAHIHHALSCRSELERSAIELPNHPERAPVDEVQHRVPPVPQLEEVWRVEAVADLARGDFPFPVPKYTQKFPARQIARTK